MSMYIYIYVCMYIYVYILCIYTDIPDPLRTLLRLKLWRVRLRPARLLPGLGIRGSNVGTATQLMRASGYTVVKLLLKR